MNINDLQPSDYKVVSQPQSAPLNIKNLTPGSYKTISPDIIKTAQSNSPFNPKTPNSQAVNPNAPRSSVQPGTSVASHLLSGAKDALGDVFVKPEQKLLADAGTRIAQAGTSAVEPLLPKQIQQNIETNLRKPQHQLGVDVAPLGTGMEAAKQIGGQTLNAVDAIGNVAAGSALAEKGAAKAASSMTTRAETKAINSTTEAVNPDLSGKKLTGAYKDVVTGKRSVTSGGVLSNQEIGTNTATQDLGKRLADLKLGKDPVKNLQTLAKDMNTTERKLTPILENDKTPIVKQGLHDALNEQASKMPREFIKDPNKTYQSVMDFAKEKISNAEPTIKGTRNARIEFDAQAKREFPSAFKDSGTIDTKTPAGQAIKDARDTINNYMYQTAEKGSEIQKLIGREADLFRATDSIAPKAAAKHGTNAVTRFAKAHPTATKVGAGVAAGAVGAPVIKHLLP